MPVHLLNTQYRMHPDISIWPSHHFYNARVCVQPHASGCPCTNQLLPGLDEPYNPTLKRAMPVHVPVNPIQTADTCHGSIYTMRAITCTPATLYLSQIACHASTRTQWLIRACVAHSQVVDGDNVRQADRGSLVRSTQLAQRLGPYCIVELPQGFEEMDAASSSTRSPMEAEAATLLVVELARSCRGSLSVGIISPYAAQVTVRLTW